MQRRSVLKMAGAALALPVTALAKSVAVSLEQKELAIIYDADRRYFYIFGEEKLVSQFSTIVRIGEMAARWGPLYYLGQIVMKKDYGVSGNTIPVSEFRHMDTAIKAVGCRVVWSVAYSLEQAVERYKAGVYKAV